MHDLQAERYQRPPLVTRSDLIVALLLTAIMLVAGYFRFTGLNWDDYVRFHPDERFLTLNVAPRIGQGALSHTPGNQSVEAQREYCLARYPDTGGVGGYFDARCSDWNPHNTGNGLYVYGTLPLFLTRVVADSVTDVTGDPQWSNSTSLHIVWRALSATADMLVILVVFAIGRQMHDKWVGLLAAALYAFAVFPIQQSHFGTADAMANLFTMLTVYFAIRVQDTGHLRDYGGFGLAFGLAMASRVNILPVVGLLIVAAGLRMLPAFAGGASAALRDRAFLTNMGGLVFAGVLSLLVFRVFNPYAFMGPGFFGIAPNPRWFDDIRTASDLVSGNADIPPNFQWVGRVDYLFPLNSLMTWGLGLALGVTAVGAWVWSGWRVLRGKPGATRNLLLFGWILVYFGWLGGNWVASMRYFLPLYGPLIVLAAWALLEIVRRSEPLDIPWRRYAAYGLAGAVTGFTLLWALMFTNIYREPATFVQASQWVWENVPGDFVFQVEDAPEDAPLLSAAMPNSSLFPYSDKDYPISTLFTDQASRYEDGVPYSTSFYASYSGTATSIYAPHLGDPLDDAEPETITITVSPAGEPGTVLAQGSLTADFERDGHQIGQPQTIPLDAPFVFEAGRSYQLTVTVSGGPVTGGGAVMGITNGWDEPMPTTVCTIPDGITLMDDGPPAIGYSNDCQRRAPYNDLINYASLETQTEDDQPYHLITYGDMATDKRERLLTILDHADYILIQTNRRYDSHARNPMRWPMTNTLFDALFDGELGFELEVMFQETFEWGPFRVSDQHLPIYDSPDWLNEFEPEEAFHVYDHPVVFVYRKTEAYTPELARGLLYGVPLLRVGTVAPSYNSPLIYDFTKIPSLTVDGAPTQLMMTEQMRETQYSGGTWFERFDTGSIVNSSQVASVVFWWLLMLLIGWVTWPLLFALLPGLADRGYGLARYGGMLLLGWGTWYLASLRVPVWSQNGLWLAWIILATISGLLAWRQRERLITYVRRRWRLLLTIEALSLGLFLFFLFVRLTNPDLWERSYGGEKPMDFAYFNAVLRSSIFPAIDPWFAGGYINYYYFGFVIVGAPTLMLGIVPAVAYNLLVPTIASATGLAAFSLAFNIVSAWRLKTPASVDADEPSKTVDNEARVPRRPLGSPYVAGIAALCFAVLIGNLDTPRVFTRYTAEMGGYTIPQGLEHYYFTNLRDDYTQEYGVPPEPNSVETMNLREEAGMMAANASLLDEAQYEVHKVTSLVTGFSEGLLRLINGETLRISPDRWFWAPTRVITEVPEVSDSSITEMPFFTFLYGDLHAHMIAMPLILLAAAFVFNELMLARKDQRSTLVTLGSLALGAIAVGMSQAVNTWDWPTLMILSGAGLSYAWFLRWWHNKHHPLLSRRALLDGAVRVGGFFVMSLVAVAPYDAWFATGFTELQVWQGANTRLWSYLTIHGLFLFFIVGLLVWETARWLRSLRVRDLKGRAGLLTALLMLFGVTWLLAFAFFFHGERVLLVALPLIPWIAVLFFRPKQSRPMQYVLVLAGLSLCITMGVEFFVLSGDNGRQNMVFKFYIQVWLFLSVAAGAALSWLVSGIHQWRPALRGVFLIAAGLLIFAAALYPVVAVPAKAAFRLAPETPTTLDGMDFMRYTTGYWETGLTDPIDFIHDYEIIRWLQENVSGSPVIMEAQAGQINYQWGGRIAMFTGLPSVVGWDNHQRQQRSLDPLPQLVNQRTANVNAFYTTTDITTAQDLLRYYDVGYVILGAYEESRYRETGGLDKFDTMVEAGVLEVAFEFEHNFQRSRVFRVNQEALRAMPVAALPGSEGDDGTTSFEIEVGE